MATVQTHRELRADAPMERTGAYPARRGYSRLHRISWGAIIAGIVISMVVMLAFNMLGLSIGAATINPAVEADPVEPALATGAVIWLIGSTLISLFLGGYVAGYMSGSSDNTDGAIHGLVTWGVVTLITFALLTTSVGNVVNGVVNAASQAISTVGSVVAETAPEVAQAVDAQTGIAGGIGTEIRNMLMEANAPTTPGTDGTTMTPVMTTGTDASPTLDEIEINSAVMNLFNQETIADADRQEVVTLISDRTGLAQAEVTERLTRWETLYVQARTEAEEAARNAAQVAADAVTMLAGAMFAAFIAGAFAAGVGGIVGTPDPRTGEAVVTVEA